MPIRQLTQVKQRPRRFPRRRGGALLEAALVLPIMLAFSFGAVEFGYFIFLKQAVQGAAREGARTAILPSGTTAKVNTAVSTAMSAAGLDDTGYTIQIFNGTSATTVDPSTAAPQTPIRVVVSCPWSSIHAGMRPMGLIGEDKQMTGVTVMTKE